MLETQDDLVMAIARNGGESRNRARHADSARCSARHSQRGFSQRVLLEGFIQRAPESSVRISSGPDDHAECEAPTSLGTPPEVDGEWMGLLKLSPRGAQILRDTLEALVRTHAGFRSFALPDRLQGLLGAGHPVRAIYSTGQWLDIDTADDLAACAGFL